MNGATNRAGPLDRIRIHAILAYSGWRPMSILSSLLPRFAPRRAAFAGALALGMAAAGVSAAPVLQNPVMFVTQFPITADFATIGSVFANHRGGIQQAGRGGDLYIRYPDGTLRNLTQEAGYGMAGLQGANAISVRDPAVSWDGTKAVFSMVVGAPTQQYAQGTYYWQLYEITGIGRGQTAVITRVAGQPADFNNVQPTYASNGDLIFVSDRPRNGERHLYPQHDEYESTPTPTGLWKLARATQQVSLMQHSPSGSFTPTVDSFGRVIFSRWDHLQRDQQAEAAGNGTFNWASEAANAPKVTGTEVFPEPRADTGVAYGHRINNFLPWMINQDGTGEETINHIGRHELFSYFNRSLRADGNLRDFSPGTRPNPNSILNFLQIVEDPRVPGRYWGIDSPEFYTHASGQIIRIDAPPSRNPDSIIVTYATPRSTHNVFDGAPPVDFSGHYRHPLPLADGQILAAHTSESRPAGNDGTRPNPLPRYQFRLRTLQTSGANLLPVAGGELTGTNGIRKTISYWDPDVLVSYNGPLWELSPVEVRARTAPPAPTATLDDPEIDVFAQADVDLVAFRRFLKDKGLALLVARDSTSRDGADRQQPFNLRVPGGVQSTASSGTVYDIAWMQFFQGDQVRGIGGTASPTAGRRVLAQTMHDTAALQAMPQAAGAPAGSVKIATDGSFAAIIPAQRAMTWQSTTSNGTPVVRERYWISAQPGEIRVCDGCHGVNTASQTGTTAARNPPQAMRELLVWWKQSYDPLFRGTFD